MTTKLKKAAKKLAKNNADQGFAKMWNAVQINFPSFTEQEIATVIQEVLDETRK